ncbi:MAG: lytic transglycosylase domain-containing protein [Alphaproteobacteria bacterium]|nr:lytic transglycosylase domain-containing protein [Alphaproteobacteria bacterium]
MARFSLLLLTLLMMATPAWAKPHAAETPAQFYHKAFQALDAGDVRQAESYAARGRDPVLNKIVTFYAMALPGNDYSYAEMADFIANNPGWPGLRGVQMIAEQKIPAGMAPQKIVAWFGDHPPVTLIGFYRYVDALNQIGRADAALAAIRTRWIEGDFTGDEMEAFFTRFAALLDPGALWARLDRLLWKNDVVGARRIMPYVDASDQAVAEARLALAAQDRNAERLADRVPSAAQSDPGLFYQKLRALVHANQDDDADEMLLNAPADAAHADAWWELREIMARRAMAKHDYDLAYRLSDIRASGNPKVISFSEFLAGWLALRFLNQPEEAHTHFQNLYDNATMPVSRARGAYWLGRAYEAQGDRNAAEQAYEDAAIFNTTYYGQLAATKIDDKPVLTAKADPPLPEPARRKIMDRDIYRAILRLAESGENDRAYAFFHAAAEAASERAEFVVLTEIAARLHRPDLGIQTVKTANQKDMLVENGGFPLIDQHVPTPPEPAFTHALIRQESMFNPDAGSNAGARGLMQLMPRTARDVARHMGLQYRESRLLNPGYSLQLGTAFVQQQIEHFNGSYILALAGYNAGAGRVREWIAAYGDPRDANVDAIDWVESIPLDETRNYVERILENIQIYRAKLAGGTAPLLIIKDLKR